MKLKVCGMRDPNNIKALIDLKPDFMGFIFYPKSVRYAKDLDEELLARIPLNIKKVGVFVNEEVSKVVALSKKYGLTYAQLHGDEDLSYAKKVKEEGIKIIKVFRVLDSIPAEFNTYHDVADYLLFDTATSGYGGSGKHFDWTTLKNQTMEIPFLLSGGVQLEDIEKIKSINLPMLAGVDVNSRFEIKPGLKDLKLVSELKSKL